MPRYYSSEAVEKFGRPLEGNEERTIGHGIETAITILDNGAWRIATSDPHETLKLHPPMFLSQQSYAVPNDKLDQCVYKGLEDSVYYARRDEQDRARWGKRLTQPGNG